MRGVERRRHRFLFFRLLISLLLTTPIHSLTTSSISSPSSSSSSNNNNNQITTTTTFDNTILQRYACTRFQPSSSPSIISSALDALKISQRSPSSFNSQPYRAILVSTPEAKQKLSNYCLGRNRDRVLDSDCTVVFLNDRECGRDWNRWDDLFAASISGRSPWVARKLKVLILLFSSGYPLPAILRRPLSWVIRTVFAAVSVVTRRKLVLLPSLSNGETWSVKNTMLFAMTYMLACASRDLATCPMEGFNVGGVRRALGISRRFGIPLIISTGRPYERGSGGEGDDDAGVRHGNPTSGGGRGTERYNVEDVVFADSFGKRIDL